jgi:hypothetical protein
MRKVLVALAFVLLACRPAFAAIALVNHIAAAGANTFTSSSVSMSGANLLVMVVTEASAAAGTPSDSSSNTWTGLTEQCVSTPCNRIYYAKNATVSGSQTFTLTGSSFFAVISVLSFSGADTTAPFDVEAGTGGGGFGTTANPGSITPGSNNEVVVTGFAWNNSQTISSVTGYTISDQTNFAGGSNYGGAGAYNIQTTATATNPTWNLNPGTTAGDVTVASFKAGAGGGGSTPCIRTLMGVGCDSVLYSLVGLASGQTTPPTVQPGDPYRLSWTYLAADLAARPVQFGLTVDSGAKQTFAPADYDVATDATGTSTYTTHAGVLTPFTAAQLGAHTVTLSAFDASGAASATLALQVGWLSLPKPPANFQLYTPKIGLDPATGQLRLFLVADAPTPGGGG